MKKQFDSAIEIVEGAKIAIVHSSWHLECIQSMIDACLPLLEKAKAKVEVHAIPGSYELPLAARHLLLNKPDLDAIIAFGVIVKGDSFHFEMILDECGRGFSQVMHDFNTPIINEIIPVLKIEDAKARSGKDKHNKGIDAALAAAKIISWRRSVRGS